MEFKFFFLRKGAVVGLINGPGVLHGPGWQAAVWARGLLALLAAQVICNPIPCQMRGIVDGDPAKAPAAILMACKGGRPPEQVQGGGPPCTLHDIHGGLGAVEVKLGRGELLGGPLGLVVVLVGGDMGGERGVGGWVGGCGREKCVRQVR